MKSKIRSLLILSIVMTILGGAVSGCGSQADNPTPAKADPPPPPTAAELKVPKNRTTPKNYGTGARYKKAMEKLNDPGSE